MWTCVLYDLQRDADEYNGTDDDGYNNNTNIRRLVSRLLVFVLECTKFM